MTRDQVQMWQYLKKEEPNLFQQVIAKLPKPVIHAYDLHADESLNEASILQIDRAVHEMEASPSGSIHPALLNEPPMILAYLYLIGSNDFVQALDDALPNETKSLVLDAMDALRPHRWSDGLMDRFLRFVAERIPMDESTECPLRKERVMEKLRSIHAPEDPQYLHPKTDVFLFSLKDQREILSQFHAQGNLVNYLACIDSEDHGRWLAPFSERQQALILDALGRVDATALDERMSRNALIDLIRQLQDEGWISTAVKYA
tara:strand:+ start:3769 stop:4548 length:780 start_codon:yes stop_codon:yes gene_type:complete